MFDVSSDLVLHPVAQWQEEFGVPPIANASVNTHIAIQDVPEIEFEFST